MFKSLSKLFAGQSQETSATLPEVLGLRLGGSFTVDPLKLQLAEPHLIIEGAAADHVIEAIGIVELDPQRRLVRYYTDDEAFLQIQLYDNQVEEIVLWYFFDTRALGKEEWQPTLESQVATGEYSLEEMRFQQFWTGQEPVVLTEQTHRPDGSVSETDQFCMAYTRDITSEHCTVELLLVSAEEKHNPISQTFEHELVRSTGFALNAIDIQNN
ncbi:DUF2491 family protein [Vibrio europaeus]|uniref:DUF2491 family protein n=1 Tax=Vibrio europaeus TaxID=300876 RepID=UPI0039E184A3